MPVGGPTHIYGTRRAPPWGRLAFRTRDGAELSVGLGVQQRRADHEQASRHHRFESAAQTQRYTHKQYRYVCVLVGGERFMFCSI